MTDQLELSVLDSGDPDRAIGFARCKYDLAIEPLDCKQIDDLIAFRTQLASTAAGVNASPPSAAQLREFGTKLYSFLVQGNIRRICDSLPNTHIRIHVYSNRPDLQALPWEYIQFPNATPGPNSLRSVVRIVPTIGVTPPEGKRPTKLRMLYVYADPVDEASVAWLDIQSTITREFEARVPNAFSIELVEGATRKALLDALGKKNFDVLHFAGHGKIGNDGAGSLVLKDLKTKRGDEVSAAQLGMALRNKGLRLVVLSACETAGGDFSKEFAVVAKTLVESGVPVVVANQFPIDNSVAATFAGGFYSELLRSGDVDLATAEGRTHLAFQPPMPGGVARIEWGIPVLYRHAGAAKVMAK